MVFIRSYATTNTLVKTTRLTKKNSHQLEFLTPDTHLIIGTNPFMNISDNLRQSAKPYKSYCNASEREAQKIFCKAYIVFKHVYLI